MGCCIVRGNTHGGEEYAEPPVVDECKSHKVKRPPNLSLGTGLRLGLQEFGIDLKEGGKGKENDQHDGGKKPDRNQVDGVETTPSCEILRTLASME